MKNTTEKGFGFPMTPAQPIEFASEEVGITIELNAKLKGNGFIEIEAEYRVAEFKRFINYGNPAVSPVNAARGNRYRW